MHYLDGLKSNSLIYIHSGMTHVLFFNVQISQPNAHTSHCLRASETHSERASRSASGCRGATGRPCSLRSSYLGGSKGRYQAQASRRPVLFRAPS